MFSKKKSNIMIIRDSRSEMHINRSAVKWVKLSDRDSSFGHIAFIDGSSIELPFNKEIKDLNALIKLVYHD
jgi:hypothetical protein